jgi:hypothetical protein
MAKAPVPDALYGNSSCDSEDGEDHEGRQIEKQHRASERSGIDQGHCSRQCKMSELETSISLQMVLGRRGMLVMLISDGFCAKQGLFRRPFVYQCDCGFNSVSAMVLHSSRQKPVASMWRVVTERLIVEW